MNQDNEQFIFTKNITPYYICHVIQHSEYIETIRTLQITQDKSIYGDLNCVNDNSIMSYITKYIPEFENNN